MITVKQLHYCINDRPILNNINHVFERGQFYALAGPNGSGKSTLLKCLCGIERHHTGEVWLDGQPLDGYAHRDRARMQTYVPQQSHAGFDFSAQQFVMMGRYPYQGTFAAETAADRELCHRMMSLTDTLHLAEQSVQTLSGGEYQRVVIARALMQQTPLIYLDEPFSQLDLFHQSAMLHLFRELCVAEGKTVVCVLHDFNQILAYADRVVLLSNGAIVAHGEPYQTLTPKVIEQVYRVKTRWASTGADALPGLLPAMPVTDTIGALEKQAEAVGAK